MAHVAKCKNIAFINMEFVLHELVAAASSVTSEIPARCQMFDLHRNAETNKDECKLPVKRTHRSDPVELNLCPGWVLNGQRRHTGDTRKTQPRKSNRNTRKSRLPLSGKSPGTRGPSTLWVQLTRHLDSTLASA